MFQWQNEAYRPNVLVTSCEEPGVQVYWKRTGRRVVRRGRATGAVAISGGSGDPFSPSSPNSSSIQGRSLSTWTMKGLDCTDSFVCATHNIVIGLKTTEISWVVANDNTCTSVQVRVSMCFRFGGQKCTFANSNRTLCYDSHTCIFTGEDRLFIYRLLKSIAFPFYWVIIQFLNNQFAPNWYPQIDEFLEVRHNQPYYEIPACEYLALHTVFLYIIYYALPLRSSDQYLLGIAANHR